MKTQHSYEHMLRSKLQKHSAGDASLLWNQMEAILDIRMPVEETKRRTVFFLPWMKMAGVLICTTTIAVLFFKNKGNNDPIASKMQVITNPGIIKQKVIAPLQNAATPAGSRSANNLSGIGFVHEKERANRAPVVNLNAGVASTPIDNLNGETSVSTTEIQWIEPNIISPLIDLVYPGVSLRPSLLINPLNRRKNILQKFVAGVSLNYEVPVNGQKKDNYTPVGYHTILYNNMPSFFVQYHFTKELFAQAEIQPFSQQYTPKTIIYDRITELNPDEKTEELFKLNKLYYLNIPVSLHYNLTPHFTVGTGFQYSQLKQVVFTNEQYYSVLSSTSWRADLVSTETTYRNISGTQDKSSLVETADTVAQSFRKVDIRALVDAGYNFGRFNLGVRITSSLGKPMQAKLSNSIITAAKNQSLQVYLKVNVLDKRKF